MELELSPLLQGREKSTIFVKFVYVTQNLSLSLCLSACKMC